MNEKILEAANKSGRIASDITIVAVTKLKSAQLIREAYGVGLRHFGENYIQEAQKKREELLDLNATWHFIGHLQRNKVKYIVGDYEYIHSVDRLSLAQEISKKSDSQKIFIQVNLSGEASKSGVAPEEGARLIEKIQDLKGLQISGLMTMPPLTDKPEETRKYFAQLKNLQETWAQCISSPHHLDHLSMGTSHDFHVAVEEGATMVRLGTVLLGKRG